jgi:hypothetical protein
MLQVFFGEDQLETIGRPGSKLEHISPNATINHPFSSIPMTFWFTIVTLLTVGYGDMFPTTIAGRIITMFSILVAMLVVALPISVVGTNFTQARRAHGLAPCSCAPSELPRIFYPHHLHFLLWDPTYDGKFMQGYPCSTALLRHNHLQDHSAPTHPVSFCNTLLLHHRHVLQAARHA